MSVEGLKRSDSVNFRESKEPSEKRSLRSLPNEKIVTPPSEIKKWADQSKEVINSIGKLPDVLTDALESYSEFPKDDKFENAGDKNKKEAADKFDKSIALKNQAKAFYCLHALEELEKLKITNNPEFKEVQKFFDTLQTKMSDKADLDQVINVLSSPNELVKQFKSNALSEFIGKKIDSFIQQAEKRANLYGEAENGIKNHKESIEKTEIATKKVKDSLANIMHKDIASIVKNSGDKQIQGLVKKLNDQTIQDIIKNNKNGEFHAKLIQETSEDLSPQEIAKIINAGGKEVIAKLVKASSNEKITELIGYNNDQEIANLIKDKAKDDPEFVANLIKTSDHQVIADLIKSNNNQRFIADLVRTSDSKIIAALINNSNNNNLKEEISGKKGGFIAELVKNKEDSEIVELIQGNNKNVVLARLIENKKPEEMAKLIEGSSNEKIAQLIGSDAGKIANLVKMSNNEKIAKLVGSDDKILSLITNNDGSKKNEVIMECFKGKENDIYQKLLEKECDKVIAILKNDQNKELAANLVKSTKSEDILKIVSEVDDKTLGEIIKEDQIKKLFEDVEPNGISKEELGKKVKSYITGRQDEARDLLKEDKDDKAVEKLLEGDKYKEIANLIMNNKFEDIAKRIKDKEIDVETANNIATYLKKVEAKKAEAWVEDAKKWAEDAQEWAKNAHIRAKKSEMRNNLADKNSEEDQKMANHEKKIEEMEKEIISNANLCKSRAEVIKNRFTDIADKLGKISELVKEAGSKELTNEQKNKIQGFIDKIKKSEEGKDNALAIKEQTLAKNKELLKNIGNELAEENKCLDNNKPKELTKKEAEEDISTLKAYKKSINGSQGGKIDNNTLSKALGAIERNAKYMVQDISCDTEQAIEHLQKIEKDRVEQELQRIQNRDKGHFFLDPEQGRFTINGVWTNVREINGWNFFDPDQTRVEYRPDIVKIEIESISRETLKKETIYTKRLQSKTTESDNYRYTLEIPGNSFANGGRREAILTIVDKKMKDGTTPKPEALQKKSGHAEWTENEYTTVKKIPMEAATTIKIKENHNSGSAPVEILFDYVVETMPDELADHAEALKPRQGPGYSPENKQDMYRLDLERRVIVHPNGMEFRMEEFDWTETKYDEHNGLTLQYKGPSDLPRINLKQISYASLDPKIIPATNALKEKKRQQFSDGIQSLIKAFKSQDAKKISNVMRAIETSEATEAVLARDARNKLKKPPYNRFDLEALRKEKREREKKRKDAPISERVAHFKTAVEMLTTGQRFGDKVKESIQDIYEKEPSSEREMEAQSQKKEQLWKEIVHAENLKEISFKLLKDPGKDNENGENVKNKEPNAVDLLREYNLYKNQKDFANKEEQEKVQDYVKKIADEFETNPDIHPYYLNQWHLQRALDAVSDENLLSKENESKYIDTVGNFILKLKQVEYPEDPNKDLASLRQADEYYWVKSLHDALAEASKPEIRSPEPLKQALSVAKWMQECRHSNLDLAQKALDPLTSSEEAKKLLESMHDFEIPSLESNGDQKSADKDGKNLFDGNLDLKSYIQEVKNKSQDQLSGDASKYTEKMLDAATQKIEELIESTSDPRLQNRYREDAVKLVKSMVGQQSKLFQQDKNIQNQWKKLEEYTNQMNAQRWKDAYVLYFTLWLKNGVDFGSRGAQIFMNEFVKMITKAI
jgi:hypothetical protein